MPLGFCLVLFGVSLIIIVGSLIVRWIGPRSEDAHARSTFETRTAETAFAGYIPLVALMFFVIIFPGWEDDTQTGTDEQWAFGTFGILMFTVGVIVRVATVRKPKLLSILLMVAGVLFGVTGIILPYISS